MTGSAVPRTVRVATRLAWLMVPAGVLLVAAGVLDLVWWASPDASRLTALMHSLEVDYGLIPPALIRDGRGAVTLIVLGAACFAYGGMAPLISKGVRRARGWAMGVAAVVFLIGLMTVGADASQPRYLHDYFQSMTAATIGARIPEIEAVLYPAFYSWFEDFAQGFGTLVALGVVVSLIWATVVDPEYFWAKADEPGPPDEWDAALGRIRKTRRPEEQA
ncbi:hypothetical protein KOI35_40290 [Actinoplanes bogorensis]|uniref:Uncharacterized protein n=1 Tax=Paractinoplanes bogorensis TaxID=1610840 RepID=A0ABS5Z274_9ACTN|nr:hypothetical protein [Actinoplanes bogorensis]MBU2669767.1 hypothetical protein [Actinoplanes bogorensis]